MSRLLLVVLLAGAFACGPTEVLSGTDSGSGGPVRVDAGGTPPTPPGPAADAAPAAKCDRMDILFVVDNSGSMIEEQENLAANFPRFIEVLDQFGDELDYRVGVTTTGRDFTYYTESPFGTLPSSQTGGDNGALLERCDMTRPWVERGDPDRAATFACAAQVGDDGPAMEMPLAVIEQAFTERVADGANAGFLRDDALLAMVVLTDEDDCSYRSEVTLGLMDQVCKDQVAPVAGYAGFLDDLTGGAGRWAVAVIAGPGPGSCTSEFGDAQEADRLAEWVGLAGPNGVFASICDGDLTVGLEQALATFDIACQEFPPID